MLRVATARMRTRMQRSMSGGGGPGRSRTLTLCAALPCFAAVCFAATCFLAAAALAAQERPGGGANVSDAAADASNIVEINLINTDGTYLIKSGSANVQYAANTGSSSVQKAANAGGANVQYAANTSGTAANAAAAQKETSGGAGAAAANAANTGDASAPQPFPPPPGEGRVHGRVLHAERKLGIANLEVALYAFAADRVLGLARTRSDAEGRFEFANISADPALSYLVGVRYQGVAHPGTSVRFAAGEREVEAQVRVNELTDSPGAIEVNALSLRVAREAGRLRIHQEVELINSDARSFYLPAQRRSLQRPGEAAYYTRLPEGAVDFHTPLGVTPEGLLQQAGRLAWFGPVHPGGHMFAFSYALPTERISDTRGAQGDAAEAPGETGAAAHGNNVATPTDAGAAHGDVATPTETKSAAAQHDAPAPETLRFEVRVPVDVPLTLLTPLHLGLVDAPGFTIAGATERLLQGEHTRHHARSSDGRIALAFELPPARRGSDAARLREIQVVLSVDDAAARVNENIALEITPGALALADREQPFFRLELPPGASNVRFAAEAPGLAWLPHPGGGLALVGAANAGSYEMQLQYNLAVDEAGGLGYRRSFEKALPLLSFFVADSGDLKLDAERLHRRRPLRSSDRNYLRLEAFELTPGEAVELDIQRRSRPAFARGAAARGMALLLALGSVLYLALPLRRGARSLARTPVASAAARERAALIATIRDLDHDLETGKLSAEDHARWRGQMFEQAAALLAREREERAFFAAEGAAARDAAHRKSPAPTTDAGEAAPPAQAQPDAARQPLARQTGAVQQTGDARQAGGAQQGAARHCPRCASPAESEAHRFCAWCGAPLPDASRAPGISQADAANAPDTSRTSDTSSTSAATNTPRTPEAADASNTTGAPGAHGESYTGSSINTPRPSDTSNTSGIPGAPHTPDAPDISRTSDTSSTSAAANTPRPPDESYKSNDTKESYTPNDTNKSGDSYKSDYSNDSNTPNKSNSSHSPGGRS